MYVQSWLHVQSLGMAWLIHKAHICDNKYQYKYADKQSIRFFSFFELSTQILDSVFSWSIFDTLMRLHTIQIAPIFFFYIGSSFTLKRHAYAHLHTWKYCVHSHEILIALMRTFCCLILTFSLCFGFLCALTMTVAICRSSYVLMCDIEKLDIARL